jgi:hypothetical protein
MRAILIDNAIPIERLEFGDQQIDREQRPRLKRFQNEAPGPATQMRATPRRKEFHVPWASAMDNGR